MIGEWPCVDDGTYAEVQSLSLSCMTALNDIIMAERPQTVIAALGMVIGFVAAKRLTPADAERVADLVGIVIGVTVADHRT